VSTTSILWDGNSLWNRCWFAANSRGQDPEDSPSSPEEISLKIVFSLLHHTGPNSRLPVKVDSTLFCWDTGSKNDKGRVHQRIPEYHDGRRRLKALLADLLGTTHAEVPDCEADDMLATAALRESKEGRCTIVASGDKDFHQLHGDKIRCYCMNQKALLTRKEILSRWGVKRTVQVAVAQAILGDKSDNIGGVNGYGPVKVQKIFETVTPEMTLEEVIDHVKSHLPSKNHPEFEQALELTFLPGDVPNVPYPSPIKLLPLREARRLGLGSAFEAYARLRPQDEEDTDDLLGRLQRQDWQRPASTPGEVAEDSKLQDRAS
jgi:5'-3' exonuclease